MIQKLVEEKKLTAEQAAELLSKLDLAGDGGGLEPGSKIRYFRVKLDNLKDQRNLMDTRFPIILVQMGIKMGRKIWADALKNYPEIKDFKVNFMEIWSRIQKDEPGKVTDTVSRDGSRQLQVWLE